MKCSNADRRFTAQQIPYERWQEATTANLAADHLNGYDLWTTAFTDNKPEWEETRRFLLTASRDELGEFVDKSRRDSLAFLVMMMTGACNADCPICFTDRRRKRGETTVEERDTVLRQAAALGAGYVYVPGEGEPTIDRGWWPFLETCKETGLEAIVFTNGLIFSDPATSRKFWDCEPDEAVARLADYPVSLYVKMWSTQPSLVGTMMGIDPGKYDFTDYDGVPVPSGTARLLESFPRDRLGVEVVVEGRNADEVADTIAPFTDRHDLARIIEIIQHNGRTLGNPTYDPSPQQVERVSPLLSPTSCSVATCKAVVTSRGYLSPRIAILESQLPSPPRHVGEGDLFDILHSTDYLVQRRYEQSCLCETEPVSLAQERKPSMRGPRSVVPPSHSDSAVSLDADRPREAAIDVFQATTSVESISSGEVEHGAEVKVVGRAIPDGPELFSLASGAHTITVIGADTPAYAWIGVEGTWDALVCALRSSRTTMIKQPTRPPNGPIASEFAMVRDPGLLQPVTDRAAMLAMLRDHLTERGHLEVNTPVLTVNGEMCQVSQALTEPILNRRFHLRTDPEEYLKRYLTAGLPAVFEISTNVRADEADDRHLVEFQSLEYYRRMMTFSESIELADGLIRECLSRFGGSSIRWNGVHLQPERPFIRVRYAELFSSVLGVDILADECASAKGLATTLRKAGYEVEVDEGLTPWRRTWLDTAFDRHILPALRQPLWVTHFPADIGLSARLDPTDERVALRAELYMPGGLELAQVYENLVDGADLRARYNARRSHRVAGGMSHVATNEALMASAEAGMPPMAGGAIGIDRLLMVALEHPAVGAGLLFAREGFAQLKPPSVCGSGGGCGNCSGSCH